MSCKPMKIQPRFSFIGTYELTFPANDKEYEDFRSHKSNRLTGRTVVLRNSSDSFISSSPKELDFASTLPFLAVLDLDNEEIIEAFMDGKLSPHADDSLTKEEALEFIFKDPAEKDVREKLLKYGYIKSGKETYEPEDNELIRLLTKRGYIVTRKEK